MSDSAKDTIERLEQLLLTPSVRKSPAELDRLLADDFREIGRSGILYTKQQIIDSIADEPACQRTLTDFEVVHLAPEVALATYRLTSKWPENDTLVYSRHSSIWRQERSGWRMVFHQGTLVK